MNDAALRRLIKYRRQHIQLNLRFGLVAGRNRRGQPFLLTFQSGQDALIQRSALFGLSFSLSGRSCVRHIVRFGRAQKLSPHSTVSSQRSLQALLFFDVLLPDA